MQKLIKGQTVWAKPVGNCARHSKEVKEAVVTSVGRKYFTLEGYYNTKFSIEDMVEHSNYTPNFRIYLSLEEMEHEVKRPEKVKDIVTLLGKLTYPQLLAVETIVKSNYIKEA